MRASTLLLLAVLAAFLNAVLLKLSGQVAWSWWWVASPLWGYAIFIAIASWLVVQRAHRGG